MSNTKRLVIDTKKPLGSPNGIRIGIIACLACAIFIDLKVTQQGMVTTKNLAILLYPFWLLIIPVIYPLYKWVSLHVVNYRIYHSLMDIVHAEQLVEYSPDKTKTGLMSQLLVLFGVKIIYEEKNNQVFITFYPRGIKNSDKVQNLGFRLEEAFNMNLIAVNRQIQCTEYVLSNVEKQRTEVSDDDF